LIIKQSNLWWLVIGLGMMLIVWGVSVGRTDYSLIQHHSERIAQIQHKQNEVNELLVHQSEIKHQSLLLSNQLKSIQWVSDDSSFIFMILPFIQMSGANLQSFHPYKNQHMRLLLSGQLSQFQAFFYLLALNQVPCRLGRFYLHHRYDHWEMIAMTAVLLGNNVSNDTALQSLATAFPLQWLSYVGWVEQDYTLMALIKLPTGRTIIIQPNDILGTEKRRVSQITKQAIQFQDHSSLNLRNANDDKERLHVTVETLI